MSDTKYVLEFEIAGLPKMANQLLRGHWRVKHAHAKKWKKAVEDVLRNRFKPAQPLASAALRVLIAPRNAGAPCVALIALWMVCVYAAK